jgi:DNA-directed RNA polymerase subunit M/transcription elongation factor TFIIS
MKSTKALVKYAPKIPRALDEQIVEAAVEQLKSSSEASWKLIPKDKLKKLYKEYDVESFTDYIEQLEQAVNDKKYLVVNLSAYRRKINQLAYNLRENGVNLFVKYSPSALVDVSIYNLGVRDPPLPAVVTSNSTYFPTAERAAYEANKPPTKVKDTYEINQTIKSETLKSRAILGDDDESEVCPMGTPECQLVTTLRQLRGAEEPMTVFYDCPCGYSNKVD